MDIFRPSNPQNCQTPHHNGIRVVADVNANFERVKVTSCDRYYAQGV